MTTVISMITMYMVALVMNNIEFVCGCLKCWLVQLTFCTAVVTNIVRDG